MRRRATVLVGGRAGWLAAVCALVTGCAGSSDTALVSTTANTSTSSAGTTAPSPAELDIAIDSLDPLPTTVVASLAVADGPTDAGVLVYPTGTGEELLIGFDVAAGSVWVPDVGRELILRSGSDGQWSTVPIQLTSGATGFAVTPDGSIAYLLTGEDVAPFLLDGGRATPLPSIGLGGVAVFPGFAAAGPAGLVVGSGPETAQLVADPDGSAATNSAVRNHLGSDRVGEVVPDVDGLLAAVYSADRVEAVYHLTPGPSLPVQPAAIAFAAGRVYVTGPTTELVTVYGNTTDGGTFQFAIAFENHQLVGMGALPDGFVWDMVRPQDDGAMIIAVRTSSGFDFVRVEVGPRR